MLKIRLRRMGSRHRPFYRVVVSDSRRVPTASALDEIGTYDPRNKPAEFKVDFERFDSWVAKGAQPSETVSRLAKKARNAPAVAEAGEVVETAAEAAGSEEAASEETASEETAAEETAEAAAAEEASSDDAGADTEGEAAAEDTETEDESKASEA
jgi:small subunit ribosomal protein S16